MQKAAAAGPTLDEYVAGIGAGDRAMLARAITLVESTKPEHGMLAQQLLQALLPTSGGALRLGITGVPGVGKSTTIDQATSLPCWRSIPPRSAPAALSSATKRA